MSREEIIKMAREANARWEHGDWNMPSAVVFDNEKDLERFFHMAQAAEREANIKIIEEYRIPVGNSSAGEMACEWTYDALQRIRDEINERGNT